MGWSERLSPADLEEVSCHVVRGPHGKECRQPLGVRVAQADSQQEIWGPQFYSTKKQFCQQLGEFGRGSQQSKAAQLTH